MVSKRYQTGSAPEKAVCTDEKRNRTGLLRRDNMVDAVKPASQEESSAAGLQTEESALSIKERHELAVRTKTEEAKNPDLYETYEYSISERNPAVEVFSARKRGRGHILKGMPCQDFCMTEETDHSVILTAADGVSSCERSHIGSAIACESVITVVKSAERHSKSEEEFVKLLLGLKFRKKVVNRWVNAVLKHMEGIPEEDRRTQMEEFQKYGSTIMFAVITEHWYIAGSLGDGQILLFNDFDAVKLRVHPPKESSRVRALVNEKCYLEDFQVAAYPRSCFNGILLSSDGMYDVLSAGTLFHSYALQIKERFSGSKEPLQPFCYQEPSEPLKDLSCFRTTDDCTIVLALDANPVDDTYQAIRQEVEFHTDAAVLSRSGKGVMVYSVKKQEEYGDIAVTSKASFGDKLPELYSAEITEPVRTWEHDGWIYAEYQDKDLCSIEFLFCSGCLREQREVKNNASFGLLKIYSALVALEEELNRQGLRLNQTAHFFVFWDEEDEKLYVRREGISEWKEEGDTPMSRPVLWSYFDSLLGVLSSGENRRPVFDTGYVSQGQCLARIDGDHTDVMCCVEKSEGKYYLKNMGTVSWRLKDETEIPEGGTVPLEEGLAFMLPADDEEHFVLYDYRTKESL